MRGPPQGSSPGPQAAHVVDAIAELSLQVHDREVAERFYLEVIGLQLLAREDDRTWLALGERARLGLWLPGVKEQGDRGGVHVHFALSVAASELDALAQRLRDAGVEVRGPVMHEGGDRSIYFQDPEGNVVEGWDYFRTRAGEALGIDGLKG